MASRADIVTREQVNEQAGGQAAELDAGYHPGLTPLQKALWPLNDMQRAFVLAYVGEAGGNATKAARIAGYAYKSASQSGWEILQEPHARAAINQLYEMYAMGPKEALGRIAEIGRASLANAFEYREYVDHSLVERDEHGNPREYNALNGDPIPNAWRWELSADALMESGLIHQVKEIGYDDEGRLKIKLHDKTPALIAIMRGLGLLKDDGAGGAEVVVKIYNNVNLEAI